MPSAYSKKIKDTKDIIQDRVLSKYLRQISGKIAGRNDIENPFRLSCEAKEEIKKELRLRISDLLK